MNYRIAQLILTSQQTNATSDIFVAQPDASKEELAGKLFLLIEVAPKKSENLKIINFLVENLLHNYYQNEKMLLRERVKTVRIEHIFESAIAKTNKNLIEFLEAEKINLSSSFISATAGVIFEDKIYFSSTGKNKAFLIFKDKKAVQERIATGEIYKIIDILKASEQKGAQTAKSNDQENTESEIRMEVNKLFPSIVSGAIPKSGYVFFTNEALPEYLSNKQLLDIITSLPPASAVEQIKNSLLKVNSYVTFLGIILKNSLKNEPVSLKGGEAYMSTQESISNLNAVEEKTEKFLTPGGYMTLGKWSDSFVNFFISLFPKKEKKSFSAPLKEKIIYKKREGLALFSKLIAHLKQFSSYFLQIGLFLLKEVRNLLGSFKDKDRRNALKVSVKTSFTSLVQKISGIYLWFKNLNKKNKVLLVVSLACLFLFAQNLIITNWRNKKAEEKKIFTELIQKIEQKQNQLEASMLYNNEDGAKKLLEELKELMAQIPAKKSQQAEFESITKKYQEQLAKISKAVIITDPEELINLSANNQNAEVSNLFNAEDRYYLFNSSQKNITVWDKKTVTSLNVNFDFSNSKAAAQDDDHIYYFNENKILDLDTANNELKELSISEGNYNGSNSLSSFNDRFYFLSPGDAQVYAFKHNGDSLSGGDAWIKEKRDLSGAVSMDIDGAVYILKNNGEILKFLKGRQEEYNLNPVEPAIEQASKLTVSEDSKFMYILEPLKKRLLVFNKADGKLIIQYQIDKFNNLKDFAVDEKNKYIYFLDGASIFAVKTQHLE